MKKKIFIISIGIFVFGFLVYSLAWILSPGSYSKAQLYEFNVPEKTLIDIINEVKTENKELDAKSFYKDSKNKHCHSFYFQYPDKNQIIHTWTRQESNSTTTFAFVGYKNKKDLGNWTLANEHFWWWKNSKVKKEFEERILKKMKDKTNKNQ